MSPLANLLKGVQTIALVGASPRPDRPSYQVMAYLLSRGYSVIPINPNPHIQAILGQPVVRGLTDLPIKVDMVDVFRRSDALMPIAKEAVQVGARILWMQLGVKDSSAAAYANQHGLTVVMDRCPKIELEAEAEYQRP